MTSRTLRLIGSAGAFVMVVAVTPLNRAGADASLAFTGSAAATGVVFTMVVAGAPVTDTLIDAGGPTAQVTVDSLGASTGHAAFPDPGPLAISAPGLITGLLSGGAGGLPPIKDLPPPPPYPFSVESDAGNAPEQSVGSGPYQLHARSVAGASEAAAKVGVGTDAAGNALLMTSIASVAPPVPGSFAPAAAVIAKAMSDVQAISVGPLEIGGVKSVASMAMDASGAVVPTSTMEITGLRIGGISVGVGGEGLVIGGATKALPINESLATVLETSKISVQVVAGQQFPGRVVAPALRIAFPFAMPVGIPNVGKYSGTATIMLGVASAALSGSEPASGGLVATPLDPGAASTAASVANEAPPSVGPLPLSFPDIAADREPTDNRSSSVADFSREVSGLTAGVRAPVPADHLPTAAKETAAEIAAPRAAALSRPLDLHGLYALVGGSGLVALALARLLRRIGLRAAVRS